MREILRVLRGRPTLFSNLSEIRLADSCRAMNGSERPVRGAKKLPPQAKLLGEDERICNQWHSGLCISVKHAIGRMRKSKTFADIGRGFGKHQFEDGIKTGD